MKKAISLLLAITLLCLSATTVFASEIEEAQPRYVPDYCIHDWTYWKLSLEYHTDGYGINSCYILVSEYYRYCRECNETQYKETQKQLSHTFQGGTHKVCKTCGLEVFPTR